MCVCTRDDDDKVFRVCAEAERANACVRKQTLMNLASICERTPKNIEYCVAFRKNDATGVNTSNKYRKLRLRK